MGCQMSKQLKAKKLNVPRSKKPPRTDLMHTDSPVTVSTTLATSAEQAIEHLEPELDACDIANDESSTKVEVSEGTITPDHAMSASTPRTAASAQIHSLHETEKATYSDVMFDDEVLAALAAFDADTREREEEAFRAILRAMST